MQTSSVSGRIHVLFTTTGMADTISYGYHWFITREKTINPLAGTDPHDTLFTKIH